MRAFPLQHKLHRAYYRINLLVSAVSALLFASMRYAKWKKYSFKIIRTHGQYGPATVSHAPRFRNTTTGPDTALRQSQIMNEADGIIVNDKTIR